MRRWRACPPARARRASRRRSSLYTVYAVGPMLWLAAMSLRTTTEIILDHYALPSELHWWNFGARGSTRATTLISGTASSWSVSRSWSSRSSVRRPRSASRAIVSRENRLIVSSMLQHDPAAAADHDHLAVPDHGGIPPRQLAAGLILVYVGVQLPLTIYLLEGFFARHPAGPVRRRANRRLCGFRIFWRIGSRSACRRSSRRSIVNFILLWNEFLYAVVLITDDFQAHLAARRPEFMATSSPTSAMAAHRRP